MTANGTRRLTPEDRARRALTAAGLDADVPLQRAGSQANEAWLLPDLVLRVNFRGDLGRLAREASVVRALPREVRHPGVAGYGRDEEIEWLLLHLAPGTELSRAWPRLSPAERERAATELAEILAELHRVDVPGLPEDRDMRPPHVLPLHRLEAQLDVVAAHPFVDLGLTKDVAAFVRGAWSAFDDSGRGLVHGDPHLENVLWHEGRISALLDFEWSRRSWIEVDLEILLAFCAFPAWFVSEDFESEAHAEDYARVPGQLRSAYPAWFAHPRHDERLAVLAISRDLGCLVDNPPRGPRDPADPRDRRNHLRALLPS